MSKKLQIRNSTAEFLVFTKQAGENTIEVRIEDEKVWLSQKLISVLFEVEVNTINYHIKEIYKSTEQNESTTIRNFRIVAVPKSWSHLLLHYLFHQLARSYKVFPVFSTSYTNPNLFSFESSISFGE